MFKLFKLVKRVVVFLLSVFAAYLTYLILVKFVLASTTYNRQYFILLIPALLAAWLLTAYNVLPAVHRILVKVYLPNYFIGRARTPDGLLGDPINLAVVGSKQQLCAVMKQAGWVEAETLTWRSTWKMIWHLLRNKSYPNAPVSSLYLFGLKQDLAFEQEVENSPHRRHHVRFWRTPTKWWLPGGYKADWLGAAVYDRDIGISAFTLQLTHKIDTEIDVERDYVVTTMLESGKVAGVDLVEHYASGFRSRNGGGDHISTDGNLPFIHLK